MVSQLWQKYMPLPNNPLSGDHFNTQGYLSTIDLPQTSNFYVGRIDHDFGEKWRFMTSYRDYRFIRLATSQVDIGGALARAIPSGNRRPRRCGPRFPATGSAGLTTNIRPTITNDLRFSYLTELLAVGVGGGPAATSRAGRRSRDRRREQQRPHPL